MTELLNAQVSLSPTDLTVTVPLADLNSTVAAVLDQQLREVLTLDYRPSDLGDTPDQYVARLNYVVQQALARTKPVTLAQQEAGARYLLISAQLRQLNRQLEEFTAVGEVTLKQGLAVRLAQLRFEQTQQLRLSGLPGSAGPVRQGSVSVPVRAEF